MNRKNLGASTNILQALLDVFVIIASLGISLLIFKGKLLPETQLGFVFLIINFGVIFIVSNRAGYLYNVTMFCYLDRMLRKNTLSFLVAAVPTAMLVYRICPRWWEAMDFYFRYLGICYGLLILKTLFYRPIMHLQHRQYIPRIAFVGDKDKFSVFHTYLDKTSIPHKNVGYIAKNRQIYENDRDNYLGSAENLEQLIREYNVDELYVGQGTAEKVSEAQGYLDLCMDMGVTVRMVMDLYNRGFAKSYVSSVGTYPVIVYHTVTLKAFSEMWKRIMDIIGGSIGILLTSPIMLITAIAIKLDSPGPVIFKQTRVGKNGRHFQIYKVRSMRTDAEACKAQLMAQNEIGGGVMFKIKEDPRITRVGRIIRKLSIDELPQFFNVVGGSMSLVGTRPPTLDEVEKYKTDQWRRISIKPGITGMWQVSGRSNIHDFDEIVKLDVDYIDNWSLWLDIKIMFKTVLVLLKHEDAC